MKRTHVISTSARVHRAIGIALVAAITAGTAALVAVIAVAAQSSEDG